MPRSIKVTDFIVQYLEKQGIRHTFMITGGGAMHLNDSFGRSKKIKLIFNHHEQACAMAAEGFARASGKLAVVCVTTGPGGLNCLSGVMGAWTDSVPILFLSGQVKTSTMLRACPSLPLRQLGDQEVDIISVVRPLTKFAQTIEHPQDVKQVLEQAIYIALDGRPGPVWIDVPMDIQGAMLDLNESGLAKTSLNLMPTSTLDLLSPRAKALRKAADMLCQAKRPLLVIGHGVRLAGQIKQLQKLIATLKIPVVTTFNGTDLVTWNHPYLVGRIGTIGQRAANLALQNADVILFFGSRNNIRQISYNWEKFAPHAYKISIDIDQAELDKPTLKLDLKLNFDLREALSFFHQYFKNRVFPNNSSSSSSRSPSFQMSSLWPQQCQLWKKALPPMREFNPRPLDKVHPYLFIQELSKQLKKDAVIVSANGTASVACFQAIENKDGQRIIFNSGCASMGYGLPAALGASVALEREVICLEGDGSLMMNLQELQTVKTYKLPLKIFIFNNHSYHSIWQTQKNFFNGHLTGCTPKNGVEFPDFCKIGKAFGIRTMRIKQNRDLARQIKQALKSKGLLICEVDCTTNYVFAPKLGSRRLPDGKMISASLEDMSPKMDLTTLPQVLS